MSEPSEVPSTDDEAAHAAAEPSAAIRLSGVTKRFARRNVLDGADLEIAPATFVAMTGPSGAGKSTTLHLCAALDHADSGTIMIADHDIGHHRHESQFRRDTVGIVFQLHNLITRLTALENVEMALFGSKLPRRARAERARELLAEVELADLAHCLPPTMSGGERQRVAVARALANRPEILLADEPTGSLDQESAAVVIEVFRRLVDRDGVTVLAVTHDDRLSATADRIIRLEHGHFTG